MKKEKEINGRRFEVTKFHAVKAFKLKTKIAKIIAQPLAALVGGGNNFDFDNILDNEIDFSSAIQSLFLNIGDENTLFALVLELLNETKLVDGEPSDHIQITNEASFNLVFNNGLKDLYALIAFVVTVNYSDLLEVVGGNIGGLREKLGSTLQSPKPVI